jgi:hypothetical protein
MVRGSAMIAIAQATDWHGLYSNGWQGEITPEAFAHPAKFSRGLIRHIYQHMIGEGWLHEGDSVVDPFGGVALGGLDAMMHGLHWTGCELEERFVALGNQNIDLWNSRYAGKMPHWGTARLVQGDSRELAAVIRQAGASVSSPPFGGGDSASAQSLVERQDKSAAWIKGNTGWSTGYGTHPGNLGNMPATERGLMGAVSSPPYAESLQSQDKEFEDARQTNRGRDITGYGHLGSLEIYGQTPGQLGAMKADGFEASVSSPPWENSLESKDEEFIRKYQADARAGITKGHGATQEYLDRVQSWNGYGESDGQLAGASDFWSAARVIVEQTYQVLAPGAHAVWVVKAFVKNKQRVDFPGQWQQLCEAVGFRMVHIHRAWLVEDRGTQVDLEGNHHTKTVERKSFFRRLAENKGSPRIDYEVVICMVKTECHAGRLTA